MKKVRFTVEIGGECNMKDNENTVLDVKQRIELRFIPYLYEKEFGVDNVRVSAHIYDDGNPNTPQVPATIEKSTGEE